MFMKEPYTALFVAPTGVGKTHSALNLIEYRHHFDFIIIICPTIEHNETYKNRGWVWNDPDVIPIELDNQLYYLIEKISKLLAGSKTLFLIDDIIADETLHKHHQPLLGLAISGRHRGHLLWLLTQSYTAIPNNIRMQAKMLYGWYPKNRKDLNTIHEENNVIQMQEELARVKAQLKQGKHTSLIMRMEHPRAPGGTCQSFDRDARPILLGLKFDQILFSGLANFLAIFLGFTKFPLFFVFDKFSSISLFLLIFV